MRSQPALVVLSLVYLNVLGMLDWLLTRHALENLGAVEANPVMRVMFEWGPGYAFAAKVLTLGLTTWALWSLRRYRPMLAFLAGAVGLYAALLGYHLAGLAGLL